MKKTKSFQILTLAAAALLVSCGGGNTDSASSSSSSREEVSSSSSEVSSSSNESSSSSISSSQSSSSTSVEDTSSSSSEEETPTISFANLRNLTSTWLAKEASANSYTSSSIVARDGVGDINIEDRTMYEDGSSNGIGEIYDDVTISSYQENTPITYQHRIAYVGERFETEEGSSSPFSMYYDVTAYEEGSTYKDSSSRQFVFSEEEANANGLSEGEYVPSDLTSIYAGMMVSSSLYTFIATIESNAYISQLGLTGFSYTSDANTTTFTFLASYDYDDDDYGVNTAITYEASVVSDLERTTLYSVSTSLTQVDTSLTDSSDTTTSVNSNTYVITYGELAPLTSDLLDVSDYFLSSIEDWEFQNTYGKSLGSKSTLSYGSNNYIVAMPTVYSPAKAANIARGNIYFLSSSDTNVIALDSSDQSVASIEGLGETSLTLGYFGKGEDEVWREYTITQTVSVVDATITGISFGSASDTNTYPVLNNSLYVGDTYRQLVNVLPSNVSNKGYSVEVNDETIATVSDDSGTLTITPLKAGSLTITVTSTANPSIYKSETFTVKEYPADSVLSEILVGSSWYWDGIYFDMSLSFASDGTGSYQAIQYGVVADSGSFNWEIKSGKLYTTSWSYDYDFGTDESKEEPSAPGVISWDDDGVYTIRMERPTQYSFGTFVQVVEEA